MPPPGLPPPLTIPSATRHLAEVRRFVAERADAAGLDARAVHAVQLAVDEACANAIKHAYAGRDDGPVTVETRDEEGRFRVIVRHEGKPFDPSAYHLVPVAEAARRRKKGGYGVALMRRLVDEVQYRQKGAVSEVHLVKRIG
jgi:serine/threonine-protein kinase RsbW